MQLAISLFLVNRVALHGQGLASRDIPEVVTHQLQRLVNLLLFFILLVLEILLCEVAGPDDVASIHCYRWIVPRVLLQQGEVANLDRLGFQEGT